MKPKYEDACTICTPIFTAPVKEMPIVGLLQSVYTIITRLLTVTSATVMVTVTDGQEHGSGVIYRTPIKLSLATVICINSNWEGWLQLHLE